METELFFKSLNSGTCFFIVMFSGVTDAVVMQTDCQNATAFLPENVVLMAP